MTQVHPRINIGLQYIRNTSEKKSKVTYTSTRYVVYQNMLYVSEYIPNLVSKLNLRCICDPDSNNNFEGEYLKGKGRLRKVKGNY